MSTHAPSGLTSRRRFLQSLVGIGALVGPSLSSVSSLLAEEPKSPSNDKRKLGIALLGLGGYSTGQLAPALHETRHCRLAGVVTGTPAKAERWKRQYNLPASCVYNYENFDRIADNPEIDIVYVVTPNALHRDFVIRAAKAGKHVICEKPMATSVEDCDRMIDACRNANRKLSIGYRLHFEPHNLEAVRIGTERIFGPLTIVKAGHGFHGSGGTWRFDKKLAGGGPLMDVGIYCVQAACYVTGEEPVAVTAVEKPKTDPERFREVEETLTWTMEFPSGTRAECITSYNENYNHLRGEAANGWFELSPAYSYRGIRGKTSSGRMDFPQVNQQAIQMDAFAKCIQDGTSSSVPGEMGRRDVRYLMAIYEAARTGKRVTL
ncbi:glucose-fructose oxidoreductase [Opitutaceae bacterium EW11]|nr:glucose-fructose oxidoreductase [Opitutaceae bacterium EW11]